MAKLKIWQRVEISGDCWVWTGCRDKDGYGRLHRNGHGYLAHRFIYELANGQIQQGMEIDHLCRNRACVNPDHMEVVTHAINTHRGTSFAVKNKSKTHCDAGHEFTKENTYIRPNGYRDCRACIRLRSMKYREGKVA